MSVKRLFRVFSLMVILSMVLSPMAVLAQGPTNAAASSSSVLVETKVSPDLRADATKADGTVLNVFMTIKAGFDVSPFMLQSVTRPLELNGQQLAFGMITARNLMKLLDNDNVLAVQPITFEKNGAPIPPEKDPAQPVPNVAEMSARLKALAGNDVPYDVAETIAPRTGDWRDVLTGTHRSALAWAKGFTGKGVMVATLDDGVDFAHPDLQGTYARIPLNTFDTSGTTTVPVWDASNNPYYDADAGLTWPYVYSPVSGLYYGYDYWFGQSNIASCASGSHLIDTSATPTVTVVSIDTATALFEPTCSSTAPHTYTFNNTSRSGVYHFGSHPDKNLIALYGERPAILVVDEGRFGHAAGVYDTVYVDLDNDYDFRDEKPMTIASPESYRDIYNENYDPIPDGFADISGGLLYWISDGENPAPGTDWMWDVVYGPDEGAGDIIGLEGPFDSGYSHGTQLSSNIVGQGRINGDQWTFADVGTPPSGVLGHAPDAKVVAMTNIYRNFASSKLDGYLMASIGLDGVPNSGDEIQITNNSYGSSDQDNDGWEYDGRFVANLQRNIAPNTVHMFSTGNGAPGFGTVAPPSAPTGIGVCASTQYGSTGWDAPKNASQILANDIQVWSNRGPGARGNNGVDICANGAFAGGVEALNYYGTNGALSWSTWGGTSRSAPVAAGIMALIFDAYKTKNGSWPDYDTARALLKSSADDVNYDTLVQGAGVLNAERGVIVASGEYGVYVMPDEWNPGDYRGTDYPAFAHLVKAGETVTQTITVYNPSSIPVTVSISDGTHKLIGSSSFTMTSSPLSEESSYTFNAPQYLKRIDGMIPANTDLMLLRANFPFDQFDADANYSRDQNWRVLVYNWTDNNGDGNLWEDTNMNGTVNFTTTTCTQIDGFSCIDPSSEIDPGEYVRFMYHRSYANNHQTWVHDPLSRMDDGLFLGLQHPNTTSSITTTDHTFQIDYYQVQDNAWLSESTNSLAVPANSSATFVVTLNVPANASTGIYEAGIYVDDPGHGPHAANTAVIPVVINVAEDFALGSNTTLAGMDAYDNNVLYNNAGVNGTNDWSWRAESGDWRFFSLDVTGTPAPGSAFLIKTEWDDAHPTDIDTLVMGPTKDPFSNGAANPDDNLRDQLCMLGWFTSDCYAAGSFYGAFVWQDPTYFGPYSLSVLGGSPNAYLGSGTWKFNTSSGGNVDWVAAPIQEGLHTIALHNVLFNGDKFSVPFTTTVSNVSLAKVGDVLSAGSSSAFGGTLEITTTADTGLVTMTFTSGVDLTGLTIKTTGLGGPQVFSNQTVTQDSDQTASTNPFDTTDGFTNYDFTITDGAKLVVNTENATTNDIDLFIFYDAGNDGFTWDDLVGSSTTGTSDEIVTVINPSDGNWRASVHGWDVSGGGTYDLRIFAVQGTDITSSTPSGAVSAGVPVSFSIDFSKVMLDNTTYEGLLQLGPPEAPTAVSVPILVHRLERPNKTYLPLIVK